MPKRRLSQQTNAHPSRRWGPSPHPIVERSEEEIRKAHVRYISFMWAPSQRHLDERVLLGEIDRLRAELDAVVSFFAVREAAE